MKKIEEIDQNFIVKDSVTQNGTREYDICKAPFSVHGLLPCEERTGFCRMPPEVSARVNKRVHFLNAHCAGGRVRFQTNSRRIGVRAVMTNIGKMPHFALTGSAGFDLYSGIEHIATFNPKFDIIENFFGEYIGNSCELREYTLNLPLYSGIKELYIILDEDAVVQKANPYKNDKPIVFYGSSITQGGCASRPGTAYPAIISRNLNLDYINLGFSGNAKGEDEMAEYIASLDMSVFIFDYDHNAPTAEHLEQTHERFFKIIRKAHPDIPIVCISQPISRTQEYCERAKIIEKTVLNAKRSDDKNVYFINMSNYLEEKGILNEASVDKCHPNDLGFYFMAEAIKKMIENF